MSTKPKPTERRGFTEEIVNQVYIAQSKSCATCGNPFPLDLLARDHVDGKRSNNSKENCQLLCRICHYKKTSPENYKKLRDKQLESRQMLVTAIDNISKGKMTGPELERLVDAVREVEKLDRFICEFPAEFQLQMEDQKLLEAHKQGFLDGIRAVRVEIK
jgi:hypothetical protein